MRMPRLSRIALTSVAILVLLLLYGPLAIPVISSFFAVKLGNIDWTSPTISAYVELTQNQSLLSALFNTLIVGMATAVVTLVLGTTLALQYHTSRSPIRELVQFLIFLPFILPPIITGLALLIFFREIDLPRSLLTVVIGHSVLVLALVYQPVLTELRSIGNSLVEASYDLGATRMQTFRFVLLPNLRGGMIAGTVLAFALSFDETMVTILVTGSESTLPIRLWGMMRLGFTPDVNALVTIIVIVTGSLCWIAGSRLMPKARALG